jgi:hypothetical protein
MPVSFEHTGTVRSTEWPARTVLIHICSTTASNHGSIPVKTAALVELGSDQVQSKTPKRLPQRNVHEGRYLQLITYFFWKVRVIFERIQQQHAWKACHGDFGSEKVKPRMQRDRTILCHTRHSFNR